MSSYKICNVLILLIACFNVSMCISKRLGGYYHESNNEGRQHRRLVINEDSIRKFKMTNGIDVSSSNDNTIIPIEFISSSNHIIINGKDKFDCSKLEQYSVLTPDSRIFQDGEEILDENKKASYYHDESPLYYGKVDDDNEVKISVDHNRRINVIHVIKSNKVTTYSSAVHEEDGDGAHKYFHNIFNNTHSTGMHDDINVTYFEGDNFTDAHDEEFFFTAMSGCSGSRTLSVIISFDTSFCNNIAYGDFNTAVSKIQSIVGLASTKYSQFCVNLKVATVEGYCDYNQDPYKNMRLTISGCMGYDGLLNDFRSYWDYSKASLPGVTAHLFTGTGFQDGPIGCSDIGNICKGMSHGVDSMSYSSDPNYQAVLFAHELGHNLGATHTNADNYVMSVRVARADYGWDGTNANIIQQYLYYANCF